ncbi:glutamine-dependent NAD(+) synthetase-like [Zingiber officinale]|uniref:glutamine-dependent NAD(+) synthetase-like n=1 Tax=Zingiber officinale TaxID=94328 RepID=UPI001C4D6F5B|nr:glutamine-dependent NAD(+) synthetase-like [Zingiber officinale]
MVRFQRTTKSLERGYFTLFIWDMKTGLVLRCWQISNVDIDAVISTLLSLFQTLTGKCLRYEVDGGSNTENLALQNIQARVRMAAQMWMKDYVAI